MLGQESNYLRHHNMIRKMAEITATNDFQNYLLTKKIINRTVDVQEMSENG